MKIGAKGKNVLVTRDEAEQSVRAAYSIAHAICFAGGFPSRELQKLR